MGLGAKDYFNGHAKLKLIGNTDLGNAISGNSTYKLNYEIIDYSIMPFHSICVHIYNETVVGLIRTFGCQKASKVKIGREKCGLKMNTYPRGFNPCEGRW